MRSGRSVEATRARDMVSSLDCFEIGCWYTTGKVDYVDLILMSI